MARASDLLCRAEKLAYLGEMMRGENDPTEAVDDTTLHGRRLAGLAAGTAERSVAALTILFHTDTGRIGEVASAAALEQGGEIAISRREPSFSKGSAAASPLGDRTVSRAPLVVARGRGGGLRFQPGGGGHELFIDGEPIAEVAELPAHALDGGVSIQLGDRVLLWLQRRPLDVPAAEHPSGLLGPSPAIAEARRLVHTYGPGSQSLLILGESGAGKEVCARALHAASPRAAGPFVAINCAVLRPELAASRLFGHRRGAFSGAVADQAGAFQGADGGTLFLDEVGALDRGVQDVLLRALEEGCVTPLGAARPVPTDVRVFAATDAPLDALAGLPKNARLRLPLLHRLAQSVIAMPPLRRRPVDIAWLFVHFLRAELLALGAAGRLEAPPAPFTPWLTAGLMAELVRYPWPGNVRQLRNVARQVAMGSHREDEAVLDDDMRQLMAASLRGYASSGGDAELQIGEGSAPQSSKGPTEENSKVGISANPGASVAPRRESAGSEPTIESWDAARAAPRRDLERFLARFGGERAAAARHLGVSRDRFVRLLERRGFVPAIDLDAEQIAAALERAGGDLEAAAAALHVSARALRRRRTDLSLADTSS